MSTADVISIELDKAERHTLIHLLDNYIRTRAWEPIQLGHSTSEIAEGAEQGRLLAQLHGLTEDDGLLPVADLDAQRANLVLWAMEAQSTTAEHDNMITHGDGGPEPMSAQERRDSDEQARASIVVDYAHRCVCERIVSQIDAAREPVAA